MVTLSGDLGAGKTTFARGLIAGLGWAGEVPSPTFNLVQMYEPPAVRVAVWHCDLYRLESDAAVDELGFEEAAGALLLVEWPERLGGWLRDRALALRLGFEGGGRVLTATVPPAWEGRWPPR